jgi:hypothetical protein
MAPESRAPYPLHTDVQVEILVHHFPNLIMCRRAGEFLMEQAAISCEGTAGARERIERLVSELSGDPPKGPIVGLGDLPHLHGIGRWDLLRRKHELIRCNASEILKHRPELLQHVRLLFDACGRSAVRN